MVQRPVLYLGEINDNQREFWCWILEGFDVERFGYSRELPADAPFYAEGCVDEVAVIPHSTGMRWPVSTRASK